MAECGWLIGMALSLVLPSPDAGNGAFSARRGLAKATAVRTFGGSAESEAAVRRGLAWLYREKKLTGVWVTDGSTKDDVAGTAFALLPFLAAGVTHRSAGFRVPDEWTAYPAAVRDGLKHLLKQQRNDGLFSRTNYSHAVATLAVCEAYGMTHDPQLKDAGQNALRSLVNGQHADGGWRYQMKTPGDTSVTSWVVQALAAGRAAGLTVPAETEAGVHRYLDRVTRDGGSTYGYTDDNATPAMTGSGLLCRKLLGWSSRHPAFGKGVEYLRTMPPVGGNYDLYALYHTTPVVRYHGGTPWYAWNLQVRGTLVKKQREGGGWDADNTITGSNGGRLVCTSLALLTLEVYYRYTP